MSQQSSSSFSPHRSSFTVDLARSERIERIAFAILLVLTQLLLVQIYRSGLLGEASRTLSSHISRWVIVVTILLQIFVLVGIGRLIRNRKAILRVDNETISFRQSSIAFSSIARLGFYQPATRGGLSGWYSIETHDGRVLRFDVHPRDRDSRLVSEVLDAIEQRSHRRWIGRTRMRGHTFGEFVAALRKGAGGRLWSWLGRSAVSIQSHAAELNDPLYRWTTPLFYVPLVAVLITIVYLLTPGVKLHYGVVKTVAGTASGLTPMPRLIIALLLIGWIFTALGVNALVVLMRTQTRNREALEAELNAAREVQIRLLPATAPAVERFELSAVCIPALEVGGDYYDFIRLPTGRLVVAIGDVSGKGLPAALLMTMVKGCLTTALQRGEQLDGVASLVNRSILEASQERTFVTMALAELEPIGHVVRLARAGHNPPLLLRASGEAEWISPDGPALGMRLRIANERRWELAELTLSRGDLLVLYTDGVTEEIGADGEQYGSERLAAAVRANRLRPIEELKSALIADLRAFRAAQESADDLTLVLVRAT